MAGSQSELRVRISADLADIRQGLGLLRGELAKAKADAAKAAPDAGRWSAGLRGIRTQLAGIVSAYAALRAVRAYADLSDQASKLEGRLKLATKSQEDFTKAYEATYQLSQSTQADWQSIVGLFSQLTQTTGESQERILSLTKVIGQAFRVSGAGAQDTSNGLRQLQQAMAGGVLRAEEFNTIIETSPRIVQALADHFGISFGRVRQYVKDGKITTQEFMAALEASAGKIQSDFDKLPKTVGGAVQEVRNALVKMIGDTNKTTGAASDLAGAIAGLARTLESPGIKSGFISFISLLVQGAEKAAILAAKVGNLASAVQEYYGALEKKSDVSLKNQRDELETAVFTAQRRSGKGLADANDPISKLLGLPADRAAKIAGFKKQIREIDDLLEQRANKRIADAAAEKKTEGTPTSPTTQTPAAKQVAASNALMRDSVTRALAELDRLYKGNEVGFKQYFATRTQLQQQAIDLEIEQARNEMAITKDLGQRRKLEDQIIILQRDRTEVGTKNAYEEAAASDALIDKLGEVKAKMAELDGNTAQSARIRIYAEYHDLFKQLEADSDETGKKMVHNLVDRLVNKAQLDAIQSKVQEVMKNLRTGTDYLASQEQLGAVNPADAERQLFDLRQRSIDQLRALRQGMADYLATTAAGSPEQAAAVAGLQQLDTELAGVQAAQHQFANSVKQGAIDALSGFFTDLATGAKSFKDAFKSMVLNFVQGLARMAAEALAKKIILSFLGGFGGGGGGAGSLMGVDITGQGFAKGGAFGSGGLQAFAKGAAFALPGLMAFANGGAFTNGIYTSPQLFQFGQGGQFGVMGEAGPEAVMPLSRGPDGKLGVESRGGSAGLVTTPIVAIGDDAVANALAGAAGERVILTHVRNNWEGLSRG